jgi:hypothetical protein
LDRLGCQTTHLKWDRFGKEMEDEEEEEEEGTFVNYYISY